MIVENAQSKLEHKPVEGAIKEFTTTIHPETPQELKAEPVTTTEATLHGVLNPKDAGDAGYYEFLYRPSAGAPPACQGYGETKSPGRTRRRKPRRREPRKSPLKRSSPASTPTPSTPLLRVHSEFGEEATSAPMTFTTPVAAPEIKSESSTVIGAPKRAWKRKSTPRLQTAYHFEYGTTAGYI